MTDFVSGYKWTELSELLASNMQGLLSINFGDDSKSRTALQVFQALSTFVATRVFQGDLKMLVSGSSIEGVYMDPRLREQGLETDFMFVPTNLILSPVQQRDVFRYIPDAPGYVRLEVANNEDQTFPVRDGAFDLCVTPVHCNKQSVTRYYVTESKELSDRMKIGELANLAFLPDNILTRSIKDTFNFNSHISMFRSSGSPAFNLGMCGIPAFVIDLIDTADSWQALVTRFFGNLCNQFIQKMQNDKSTSNSRLDENAFPGTPESSTSKAFDYMTCPSKTAEGPPNALNLDVLMAIECFGWPEIAGGFFQRKRNWPNTNILAKLQRGGFHLVYKPLDKDSADSVEWRISFSMAEITLFHNMDPFRLHIYRMFKALYLCELTLPKILCSYYMKTIFLWMCERLPKEAWVESNLAQIIMALLDELMHCLVTKNCPHYFIPECNLFAHAHEDFLLDLARKVSEIRTHPESFPRKMKPRQKHTRCETRKSSIAATEPTIAQSTDSIDLD